MTRVAQTKWPSYGVVDPTEIDPHLALAREAKGLLWVRASRRFHGDGEITYFRRQALEVFETIRSTRLIRDRYIEVWPPKEFYGDYGIALRLTLRGMEAITAIETGFCWDVNRHEPDTEQTIAYWREMLRRTRNPHDSLFGRMASIKPLELHVLRGEAVRRLQHVWAERIDDLTNVHAHDWADIIGSRDPNLAVISEQARQRHNAMWIEELQSITDVSDRRLQAVERLDDTKYRDVKNEAMFVKMRVWAPLDHNGRRVR